MNYKSKVGIAIYSVGVLVYTCMCFFRIWAWFICAFALFLCVLQGAELWTPVLIASDNNHMDILELLIQHGAQPDVRNKVLYFLPNIVQL